MAINLSTELYRAVEGSHFTDKDASIVGPELERLASEMDGFEAGKVVDAARSPSSPLHKYFEWDDSRAADKYREEQARHLTRSFEVRREIRSNGNEPVHFWVRAFHPVRREVAEGEPQELKQYVPMRVAQSDEDFMQQIIKTAHQSLLGWLNRYYNYRKLSPFGDRFGPIIQAIESLDMAS